MVVNPPVVPTALGATLWSSALIHAGSSGALVRRYPPSPSPRIRQPDSLMSSAARYGRAWALLPARSTQTLQAAAATVRNRMPIDEEIRIAILRMKFHRVCRACGVSFPDPGVIQMVLLIALV